MAIEAQGQVSRPSQSCTKNGPERARVKPRRNRSRKANPHSPRLDLGMAVNAGLIPTQTLTAPSGSQVDLPVSQEQKRVSRLPEAGSRLCPARRPRPRELGQVRSDRPRYLTKGLVNHIVVA